MFNPVLRALDDIKDPDVGLSVPVHDARGNKTYEFRIVSASFADDSRFFARNRRGPTSSLLRWDRSYWHAVC